MKIEAKSCTRVDFSGGTLDLWPLYRLIPDSITVNASINCYTSAVFEKSNKLKIRVVSPDFDESFEFDSFKDFLSANDGKLSLLQEASHVAESQDSLIGSWLIKSESPAGSGLGGSSSLLITMLKVIFQIEGKDLSEEKMIQIARDVESSVLKTPAGIQDYFSPVSKGLNAISYEPTGFKRESLNKKADFWKNRILIIDSEIKHHSGFNNWQILKCFIEGEETVVKAMNKIAEVSRDTKKALLNEDIKALSDCFRGELEARKEVSSEYISEDLAKYIDKLNTVKEIESFKVCGAGGGGCLLLLFDPEKKQNLVKSLNAIDIKILPFELEV